MATLTNSDIDKIETMLGFKLPALYHRLLFEIGPGAISGTAEIYDPRIVNQLYAPFFDEPAQLFRRYFPFGCQKVRQEMWIIDASTETAASIWHETVPDDWPDEKWLPYESWLVEYLAPEMRQ